MLVENTIFIFTSSRMLQFKLVEFRARRARSGPFPDGVAPVISSATFRDDSAVTNSKTLNEDRLSRESRARHNSTLEAASTTSKAPSLPTISLGTARPASIYFPWQRISLQTQIPQARGCIVSLDCLQEEEAYDLNIAMNYGYAAGSPQLLRFVTEHVELVHCPPYRDWSTALTCGTMSAFDIVLRMLCDCADAVLVEEYTYSGMIEAARPLGTELVGVRMDEDDLVPEVLDEIMRTWSCANGTKPKALYTIPCGHNPTGVSQSKARREAVYAVAEKHDLFFIEDDPSYFLQLG